MTTPNHYSSYRTAATGLAVLILLIGGLAGLTPTKMAWAAGPLLLLGLAEIAAQASVSVVRTTLAVLPFYLGLFGIVAIGGEQMAASTKKAVLANIPQAGVMRTAATSKSGGCGSSGCGSGSCGSSSGCSSGGCGSGGCSAGGGMMAQMSKPTLPRQMSPQQAQTLLEQARLQQPSTQQRLPNGAIIARPANSPAPLKPSPARPVAPDPAPQN